MKFLRHFAATAFAAVAVAAQAAYPEKSITMIVPFPPGGPTDLVARVIGKTMSESMRQPIVVPTLAESGMPGFDVGAWQGLMVPAGTPRPIIDRLNAQLRKALANPEVRAKLAVQRAEPLGSTPEEYGAYIRKEIDRWGKVVQQSGVKAE